MDFQRWRRILLIGSAVVAVVFLVALLWPDRKVKVTDLALKAAEAYGKGFEFGDKAEGWRVRLATCRSSDESKLANCDDVKITYATPKNGELVVTGLHAKVDMGTKELDLMGDVTLTSSQITMRTDKVHYSPQQRLLTSDDPVSITGTGLTMSGTGLDVEVPTQTMRLRSNVVTRIEPKSGGPAGAPGARAGDGKGGTEPAPAAPSSDDKDAGA